MLKIIDNLGADLEHTIQLTDSEVRDVSDLVINSLVDANEKDRKYEDNDAWKKIAEDMGAPKDLKEKTRGSYTVIYLDDTDGKIIGYGRLEREDLKMRDGTEIKGAWQLKKIHVSPEAQGREAKEPGKGVGTSIVRELEKAAISWGIETLFLESWLFEQTSGFYRKKGYIEIGNHPWSYYGISNANPVMAKGLGYSPKP